MTMKVSRDIPIAGDAIGAKTVEEDYDLSEQGRKNDESYVHEPDDGHQGDDSSHNKSSSDTHPATGTVDDDIQSIKDALSRKESQQVFRLRALVILILILVAFSISLAVFWLERKAQIEQFESAFYGIAGKVIDSLEEVTEAISGLSALGLMAAMEAEHQELEHHQALMETTDDHHELSAWPLVTINRFQEHANNVRALSKSIFVSVNPIVALEDLIAWESYVQSEANIWIAEGFQLQEAKGLDRFAPPKNRIEQSWLSTNRTVDPIHTFDDSGVPRLSAGEGPFLPRWQTSPVLPISIVNENLLFENPVVASIVAECIAEKSVVLGGFLAAPPGSTSHPDFVTSVYATLLSMWEGEEVEYQGDPVSYIVIPIFEETHRTVVGVVESVLYWRWFLTGVLPPDTVALSVVIGNDCTGQFTYQVDGSGSNPIGVGDKHDRRYSSYRVDGFLNIETIEDGTSRGIPFYADSCPYYFHVYPTDNGYHYYVTNQPVVISAAMAVVFAFAIAMFLIYDRLVERRQRVLLAKATQTTAIVSSLFPKQVRDRLLVMEMPNSSQKRVGISNPRKDFLNESSHVSRTQDEPIADFFPSCTVFFADIAGFTAWSSTREPSQVFVLLQAVYQNFDAIAKRRRVFKIETIGDSYLAVTGLPEPQPNHAIIMVKFAWDCLVRMAEITKELEVTLGPDTNDLSMRFGLHSGSVTAGVLKGDRARFQLFGDTVNTASRMESTGMKGRIQVSEETAELLRNDGKGSWLTKRVDPVHAKGKGTLTTYWVTVKNYCSSTTTISSDEDQSNQNEPPVTTTTPSRTKSRPYLEEGRHPHSQSRLVDWMTKVLLQYVSVVSVVHKHRSDTADIVDADLFYEAPEGIICLDEVPEAIVMPEFNMNVHNAMHKSNPAEIPKEIADQLRAYVVLIARSYRQNPFHNFEHACHVVMSVTKLLRRILVHGVPSSIHGSESEEARYDRALECHNKTHGLASDPMCSFAMVFSALVHDVDHQGISNEQLMKEEPAVCMHYRNRCVAEQNSIDVAWDLLMSKQFLELRRFIFASHEELMRFRQLLVNNVIATDIFDEDNRNRRSERWHQVRSKHNGSGPPDNLNDLRATIIMEHVMQASDVSNTMQHWHVYIKWNRKLFAEMYKAWKEGKMAADPREFWYKGELEFFDNYVIPLATRLKEYAVFGVSSAEYLGYAIQNRSEWEERGEDVVRSMIDECDLDLQIAMRKVRASEDAPKEVLQIRSGNGSGVGKPM